MGKEVDKAPQALNSPEKQLDKPSADKEYKSAIRRDNSRKAILFLLIIAEAVALLAIRGRIVSENLQYRTLQQISHLLTGTNSFSSGIYTGDIDFGYLSGNGSLQFRSGTLYEGQWLNNEMDGLGILNVPGEGIYEGGFLDSQKNGHGRFTWEDGSSYDGMWKNDQIDGQGTYISFDGVTYSGTFRENRFCTGVCTFDNSTGSYIAKYKDFVIDNLDIVFEDGTVYKGSADGKALSGNGTMTFPNGDVYSGNFKNGKRSGNGVYIWKSGDKYDGEWEKDAMNGAGTYTYADSTYAHGLFENNHFMEGTYALSDEFGKYTFQFNKGEISSIDMTLKTGTTYSGEVSNGELTGSATIHYSNGDSYSGKVENGLKNGQGNYIWSSGASYEGGWKADQMDGQGTYFYPQKESGLKLVGPFKNGVPNGRCKYYESANTSFETDWSNGRCVKIYE